MVKHIFKNGTTDIEKVTVPSEIVERVKNIVERGRDDETVSTPAGRTKKTG